MLKKEIEKVLNEQISAEANSSQYYLAMASWAETKGFEGVSSFFYNHSNEEREHMLKLIKYVNERGGHAIVPELKKPPKVFDCLAHVFQNLLDHEIMVTNKINIVVDLCLKHKDYTTHNFMQWYVAEQIEEEALARTVLDKLKLIGDDKGGLYLFDRDILQIKITGN
tara:strand:- start:41 stop:541 length:501 start_codon:yes stop_codon:yes gene_type:complete